MKILLVEDELKVAAFIKAGLETQACNVDVAYDGQIGLSMAKQTKYDVIILDINLPSMPGFTVCQRIREFDPAVPVLMLTALGSTEDKLTGFEAGADDYLVKPFEFLELLARVKALHKRGLESTRLTPVMKIADLEIDMDEATVRRSGKKIELTAKEFALLTFLMKNRGKVVSRAAIAEKVWDISFDTGTNVIDVYITFLRKKIDRDFSPKLIHTVVGMGYILKEEH